MIDDLDLLKSRMDQATPEPDAARRAANLALAQANFAALHRSATPAGAPSAGLRGIWDRITSKGVITATAAIAAFALILTAPQGIDQMRAPVQSDQSVPEVAAESSFAPLARTTQMDDVAAAAPQASAARGAQAMPPAGLIDIGAIVSDLIDALPASLPQVAILPTPWDAQTQLLMVTNPDRAKPLRLRFDPDLSPLARQITGPADEQRKTQSALLAYEISRLPLRDVGALVWDGTEMALGAQTRLPDPDAQFLAAITGFALLQQGQDLGAWGYHQAITLAAANTGADPTGQRAAVVNLMQNARDLAR